MRTPNPVLNLGRSWPTRKSAHSSPLSASLHKEVFTFLGFHRNACSSPYFPASCAILFFSVTVSLEFSVRPPNPSNAGCVKGIRPYLSGVGGGGGFVKDLPIKSSDSCRFTILLPMQAHPSAIAPWHVQHGLCTKKSQSIVIPSPAMIKALVCDG